MQSSHLLYFADTYVYEHVPSPKAERLQKLTQINCRLNRNIVLHLFPKCPNDTFILSQLGGKIYWVI
jgi:hypothetical protein